MASPQWAQSNHPYLYCSDALVIFGLIPTAIDCTVSFLTSSDGLEEKISCIQVNASRATPMNTSHDRDNVGGITTS